MHRSQPASRVATPRNWNLGALAVILVACFVVAAVGGLVTSTTVDTWYVTLKKPPITPPDWIFAPVWNLLYLLMGLAAWRIWRRAETHARNALWLFALQLLLNLAWSILFFGFMLIGAAFVDILLLIVAVTGTMVAFFRVDKLAGLLLLPYLAWVSYAALLIGWIWVLN